MIGYESEKEGGMMDDSGYNEWWSHSLRENTGWRTLFWGAEIMSLCLTGFSYLLLRSICCIMLFSLKYIYKKSFSVDLVWKGKAVVMILFFLHVIMYSPFDTIPNWTSDSFLRELLIMWILKSYQWTFCTLVH